jgi:hypothetical protein
MYRYEKDKTITEVVNHTAAETQKHDIVPPYQLPDDYVVESENGEWCTSAETFSQILIEHNRSLSVEVHDEPNMRREYFNLVECMCQHGSMVHALQYASIMYNCKRPTEETFSEWFKLSDDDKRTFVDTVLDLCKRQFTLEKAIEYASWMIACICPTIEEFNHLAENLGHRPIEQSKQIDVETKTDLFKLIGDADDETLEQINDAISNRKRKLADKLIQEINEAREALRVKEFRLSRLVG